MRLPIPLRPPCPAASVSVPDSDECRGLLEILHRDTGVAGDSRYRAGTLSRVMPGRRTPSRDSPAEPRDTPAVDATTPPEPAPRDHLSRCRPPRERDHTQAPTAPSSLTITSTTANSIAVSRGPRPTMSVFGPQRVPRRCGGRSRRNQLHLLGFGVWVESWGWRWTRLMGRGMFRRASSTVDVGVRRRRRLRRRRGTRTCGWTSGGSRVRQASAAADADASACGSFDAAFDGASRVMS